MADTSPVYHHSDLPQSQNIVPRLGTPGTPDFFASLLEYIRVTAPDVPLDPVIFQAIVLCVMAGNKHILLRPREEDVAIVQNLAVLVSNFVFVSHPNRRELVRSARWLASTPVFQPNPPPSLVFSLRAILTVPTRYSPTYLAIQPTNMGYHLRREVYISPHRLSSLPSSPHLIKEHQQAGWPLRGCAQGARCPILSQTTTDDTEGRPANWTFRRLVLSANAQTRGPAFPFVTHSMHQEHV